MTQQQYGITRCRHDRRSIAIARSLRHTSSSVIIDITKGLAALVARPLPVRQAGFEPVTF